jgi:hypothetical protein
MGFEVHVEVLLLKSANEAVMTALNHEFGVVTHELGSKTVNITEHVSVSDHDDAVAFVRSLVQDAIPDGAKITAINASAD